MLAVSRHTGVVSSMRHWLSLIDRVGYCITTELTHIAYLDPAALAHTAAATWLTSVDHVAGPAGTESFGGSRGLISIFKPDVATGTPG